MAADADAGDHEPLDQHGDPPGSAAPSGARRADATAERLGDRWPLLASGRGPSALERPVIARVDGAEADERHISPLQLTVIRRCIDLWSNPGDVVFSPFTGIGSAGYVAIEKGFLGRKPRTQVRITPVGRKAFAIYLEALGKLIGPG